MGLAYNVYDERDVDLQYTDDDDDKEYILKYASNSFDDIFFLNQKSKAFIFSSIQVRKR